jgi:hypothetical protein
MPFRWRFCRIRCHRRVVHGVRRHTHGRECQGRIGRWYEDGGVNAAVRTRRRAARWFVEGGAGTGGSSNGGRRPAALAVPGRRCRRAGAVPRKAGAAVPEGRSGGVSAGGVSNGGARRVEGKV